MKKKILHVNQYGCYRGGVENYIREIVQGMDEYEHYLLYALDENSKYLNIFSDSFDSLQKTDKDIEESIRKIKPNHIIVYNINDKSMEIFFKLRSRLGFKIIKSFHDYQMIYAGTGYNRLTLKRSKDPISGHSISGCITRDGFIRKLKFINIWKKKKLLTEVNKVDAIEIHTEDMQNTLVRNSISSDKMYWNPPWAKIPKKSNINPESNKILFIGNLIRGKGLQLLLRTLKKINKPYILKVAGDGYQRKKLEKYAVKHKLNVEFLGHVPKEKIADLYQSSLFVVLPSILEPFSFVMMESMSHKRAIVAFDAGGNSEGIEDNINGYLIRPFDLDVLASKIEYLLDNPNIALKMGQKGYENFLSKFTFEHHLQRLHKKLLELES
jgi:glycosyltransferase involved in cell wall biosynthesis